MSQRFPKDKRLRKRSDFIRVYREGKKFSGPYFTLYLLPVPARAGRLGLTVSKKVGNAAKRNRIKRVLREYFRCHQQHFEHLDVVIQVKPQAAQTGDTLDDVFKDHLMQALRLL